MAILKPFRALRFDPKVVGDVATVVAPPYDVIDAAHRDRLYARSPFNVVQLILNREDDPYGAAARCYRAWRADGALAFDPAPALYLYAQRFPLPGAAPRQRFGVIGALRLEDFATGKVRPHERTLERAKSDRLNLIRACNASLSPIFGLVSDPAWSLATLVPSQAPIIDVEGDDGTSHRVWRIDDAGTLAAITARLDGKDVFIADGHHRYETALRYRDETRAALGASAPPLGSAPYDYVLAYLTTLEEPGLVVLPTHRILTTLPLPAADLRRALAEHFAIDELPWTEAGKTEVRRRLRIGADASNPSPASATGAIAIGAAVHGADRLWVLSAPSSDLPYPSEVPDPLRDLDVAALHQIILARVLGLPIGERGGTPGLGYTQNDEAAFDAVESGRAAAAFFVPPTDVDALRVVGGAGLTMPEKSTYFHPKLLTGLVVYPLDGPPESKTS